MNPRQRRRLYLTTQWHPLACPAPPHLTSLALCLSRRHFGRLNPPLPGLLDRPLLSCLRCLPSTVPSPSSPLSVARLQFSACGCRVIRLRADTRHVSHTYIQTYDVECTKKGKEASKGMDFKSRCQCQGGGKLERIEEDAHMDSLASSEPQ